MSDHSDVPDGNLFTFAWFVFDLIIKALALKLHQHGDLNGITLAIVEYIICMLTLQYRCYF